MDSKALTADPVHRHAPVRMLMQGVARRTSWRA